MTPVTSPRFDDAAARVRIRESLAESLVVEAAAGTGKTTELVNRIVQVLRAGLTTIDKIVAVTFTHKAAGELKLRLRVELDRTRNNARDAADAAHLEHALAHLEEASIGTIHAFCAQLLRERPVEAAVDPAFGELAESEQSRLFDRAFRSWMERQLNQASPGLRRALSRLAYRDSWESGPPADQLKWAGRMLIEWRDFPAPWRRMPWDREAEIDGLVSRIRQQQPRLRISYAMQPVHDFVQWLDRAEWSQRRDYDTLESLLLKLRRDMRNRKSKGLEDLLTRLEDFRNRADADLAAQLREEMIELLERYEELKRKSGKLDFLDLLILARNLVRDREEVREYLQRRYTHIFVDEFQDTDPLQAEILLLLAADDPRQDDWTETSTVPGKLFAVGDPKQSIYKFRRADVTLYQSIRDRLVARGAGLVHLTRSWRSVRPIQECVNAAFAPEMTGDVEAGQADYVPLDGSIPPIPGQPAIVALPAPRPYGMRSISKQAINACLPDSITAFVSWLIQESGWKVRAPEPVPIQARHICILFRRFTNFGSDLTRDYARGLEARGVPHVLVGSKSFHHREEVETLRTALTAIEWPDDELSNYATLRGAMFAIDDATLLRYSHEVSRLLPFAKPSENALEAMPAEFEPVRAALELLADLHRGRNWRPIAETVNRLLEATRAHAGFALRPAGNQVLANVYRIADLARQFELSGGISFRGFVEELAAQAEKAEVAEAPVLEEGAEGVRMMTVHAAKGLEFPVVILADMTANLSANEPERFVDPANELCATRLLRCAPWELLDHVDYEKRREDAEGVRVAYVAATRAKDLMVIPVAGDYPPMEGSWLVPLSKAIYPEYMLRRQSAPAPGCPKFGGVTVVERPPDHISGPEEESVKPGQHRPQAGPHKVVWWCPRALPLNVEPMLGLTQEEILAETERSAAGAEAYQSWRSARDSSRELGEEPSFDVFLATEARQLPEGFSCPVTLVTLEHPPGRPGGKRFGSLVHDILRDVALDASPDRVLELARLHSRILGAPEEELQSAAATVLKVLAHDLIARARRSERMHREWPLLWRDGERIVEGVIDLAFLEESVWRVIDFKTDEQVLPRLKEYETQLRWYALALAKLTGFGAECWLMGV